MRRRAACALLMFALVAPAPAVAQKRPERVWIAPGLGGGTAHGGAGGLGVMGQLVYERAPHHFSLRGLVTTGEPGGSDDGYGELGALYGRFAGGGFIHAGAAAGLSFVHLDRCGNSYDSCATVGIPLAAHVAITPFGVIGLGLQVYANINPRAPYGGMFLIMPIGWMP
ncbi:MAG TPA: hypothetical protein VK912_20065 [Longimicrobiales bacterium]|nr:hypothetical protein [Longimicrobiales bacterium]